MESRIADNLRRVTDPAAKLRLAAKHNLRDEVVQILTALTEERLAYFWTDHEDKDILFDTLADVHKPGMVRMDNPDDVRPMVQHRQRVLVIFERSNDQSDKLKIDFGGLQAFLGWTDEMSTGFVGKIIERLIAVPPSEMKWRLLRALTTVRRQYIPDGDDLATRAEIWMLQCHLRGGRLFELRKTALPTPIEENAKDDTDELDPIVDRFLELGWTQEQVRKEFLELIQNIVKNCRPQWMLTLAGAKCFSWRDAERNAIMRDQYRPYVWQHLVATDGDFWPEMFRKFVHLGFYDREEADKTFFRNQLVEMLGKGQFNRVWQIVVTLGRHFLFYAEMEQSILGDGRKYLLEIVPAGFKKAYANGRFGTAAALVQQFGAEACFSDKLLQEEVAAQVAQEQAAVDARYPEVIKLRDDEGLEDEYLESGIGKEWSDAHDACESKGKETLAKLQAEAKDQIEHVTQLALDLSQPIRFEEPFVYYVAPSWPKH